MAITETQVTGKKYRVWDAAKNAWQRLSFWTKASDVEMNDGTTVQDTLEKMAYTNMAYLGSETEETDEVKLDAETLGGHPADYFATNASLKKVNQVVSYEQLIFDTSISNTLANCLSYYSYDNDRLPIDRTRTFACLSTDYGFCVAHLTKIGNGDVHGIAFQAGGANLSTPKSFLFYRVANGSAINIVPLNK